MIKQILKEPLVHFLALGALLFLFYELTPAGAEGDDRTIRVGNEQLARMLVFRNPRLDESRAMIYIENLDDAQRTKLAEDFVREEVLYREAVTMGLDRNDRAARQRLIAQLQYINQGFISDSIDITEADLKAHYEANRNRYYVAPQITFTHVFFSDEVHGANGPELAQSELVWLTESALPFHKASTRGDHFLYHRNYVNREAEEIASHFGDGFAEAVFKAEPGRWSGPIQSAYGVHLVQVSGVREGYVAELDEVRGRVLDEVTRLQIESEQEAFYLQARERYQVDIVDEGA